MNLNATLLGQMFTFMIFVWFTMKFVWPLISQAMTDREKKIADGLAAAVRGQQALSEAQVEIKSQLNDVKQKANDIIALAEKRAGQMVEDAKQKAKADADQILVSARAEIEREVLRSKEILRQQVADLAVMGAEKILKKHIDLKTNASLLAELAEEI